MVNGEKAAGRRKEIIDACEKLYETMSFSEITIKEIASFTSFTRPSIYNYFQTKEEIFLALLGREYDLWVADLKELNASEKSLSREEFAKGLAGSISRRPQLLHLLSTSLNDMEQNSRIENLVEFKKSYGASLQEVSNCLDHFCPDMGAEEKQGFLYSFFPLIYGIYPYSAVTNKQREAMEQAGIDYNYMTIYEIALNGANRLLGV